MATPEYREEYYKKHRKKFLRLNKAYYLRTKAKKYIRFLKNRYNMTIEDYNKMLEKQNGLCAICREKKKLSVDHDHNTGKIRGLICTKCNTLMVPFVEHHLDLLDIIKTYLLRNNT